MDSYLRETNKIEISFIESCARCGKNHKEVIFERLENPIEDYRFWAPCPINGQPILLKMVEDG